MSKTDSLLRLLAILRFSVPSNSSRTLNATQAYDVTSSGITLASAIGKLVDKSVAVKDTTISDQVVQIGFSVTAAGVKVVGDVVGAGNKGTNEFFSSSTAALNVTRGLEVSLPGQNKKLSANKCDTNVTGGRLFDLGATNSWTFAGTATSGPLTDNKSKATNTNTTFYGAIPVATGDYKKWQGKYAVLKINTVTGNGVLRIYDDA